MNKRHLVALLVVGLATATCLAQVASNFSDQPPSSVSGTANPGKVTDDANGFQQRYPRYQIERGDQFDLSFELSPEFNQSVAVQPDGFVSLRGVGDVYVAGETVPELTQTLKQAYSKILKDPLISVVLKDFEKPYFIADGQVEKPGKYDLRGDTTLTQAIAMAGGFRDSAKHSQVLLFRRVDRDWLSAKIINVKKMESKGDLKEDPYLHPGDMLFVPKNRLSKIMPFLPRSSMGGVVRSY